jgi:hypothetical protein
MIIRTRSNWFLVLLLLVICTSSVQSTLATTVFNEDELKLSIQSNAIINLGSNIYLNSAILISNVHDLIINGFGFEINGQRHSLPSSHSFGCFSIDNSSVQMLNLQVASCSANVSFHTPKSGTGGGGGLFITGNSNIVLIGCNVSDNAALNGGGIYAENGTATISIYDSTISSNTAVLYFNVKN